LLNFFRSKNSGQKLSIDEKNELIRMITFVTKKHVSIYSGFLTTLNQYHDVFSVLHGLDWGAVKKSSGRNRELSSALNQLRELNKVIIKPVFMRNGIPFPE
jgi:hypothetical protein